MDTVKQGEAVSGCPEISLQSSQMVSPYQCIIIGGGVGGCCTALEMADAGYDILIVEREPELMICSSDVTPGRIHLGFHNTDLATACYYLHASVRFVKQFGKFRDAVDKPLRHPLRRGRYFILKTSQIDPQAILKIYEGIKDEYANMVVRDPSNEVFGSPDDLYRVLDETEYADDVDPGIVAYGLETAEELLDWKRFREYLQQEVKKRQRTNKIKVHLCTEVEEIQRMDENVYDVSCCIRNGRNPDSSLKLFTSRVVNSAWYNIGKLNKTCGLKANPRLNRVKAIATIQLPPGMENCHSMFFCAGSYGMLCNKGKGIGMITFAPETNLAMCTSDDVSPEVNEHLHRLTSDEKQSLGERILQGVARYIPKLATAKILKVNTGVVQTYFDNDHFDCPFKSGNLDFIHDPSYGIGINKRDYSGVEVIAPGFVVNACMKLLYCMDNARAVRKIFHTLDQH